MPKLMKPSTFGCENGFQEVFYEVEDLTNKDKVEPGKSYCYLARLTEEEKTDKNVIAKCRSMKAGQCWKVQ